ncbi:alpha/beta hydrolase [Aquimarina mytili]|uniref:Alpha/beta hydrolase n=1 Tax=Aquimarina mytili TaxID=874423 RepID=A0A937D5B5_9FLAO|nr:alpha/beta hydrolase [Aquimarina mytili]
MLDNQQIHLSIDYSVLSKEKKTIIFLHDSLGCIALWRNFPERIALKTQCNTLSYDRLGYGKSAPFTTSKRENDYLTKEAEILAKIIDQLQLTDVVLFGHSDGGSIALLTAALFPKKITGIITEGAHVFVEKETISGIKEAVIAYKNTNLKEKLSKYHGDKTDDVFRMWTETWLSDSYQSWNIEKYLPMITCPSLIIQGEKDEFGTIKQVTSIVENTSGNSIPLVIPGIGHTPHKESSEAVLQNTVSFINDLPKK